MHTHTQVVRELTAGGAFDALTDALDGVLARVQGRDPPLRTITRCVKKIHTHMW